MNSLTKSSSSKTICSLNFQSCVFYDDDFNVRKGIKDKSSNLTQNSKELLMCIDKEHDVTNNFRKSSLEYEEILHDMFIYKEKDLKPNKNSSISTKEKKNSLPQNTEICENIKKNENTEKRETSQNKISLNNFSYFNDKKSTKININIGLNKKGIANNKNNDNNCPICHDKMFNETTVSCSCVFCFDCINRHLKDKRFCPSCGKIGINSLDIKPSIVQKHQFKRLYKFNKNSKNMSEIVKFLKYYEVNFRGDKKTLWWRYKELICLLECASYKEHMITKFELASAIQFKEDSKQNFSENKTNEDKIYDRSMVSKKLMDLKKKFIKK